MDEVIQVERLSKRYGSATVVDDVSFVVGRGEIFGIVGPNGAGKTTTVECVMGLRRPDGGTIRLLGAAHPGTRILVLTTFDTDTDIARASRPAPPVTC
jgi:ABC-type multidrug transport system ATPase subunit